MTTEDLIRKYNTPTPRYTSYPPANYFNDAFTETDYREAIAASNRQSPKALSFYIHIPFCPKLCYYCGCNSYPMESLPHVKAYVDAVKKEMGLVLPLLDKDRRIAQIHYGGGTPNAIPVHFLEEINDMLLSSFSCIDRPEIAIECHPGYYTEKDWKELAKAGFNRCSIGVQDFDENVLRTCNRQPSRLPLETILPLLHEQGMSVNMDFIYGLPGQTAESFSRTIKRAASLRPDRLVTFSYAHVPWVNKNQLILERAGLPPTEVKGEMFRTAAEIMTSHGYVPIGLDHFVQPGDALNLALQRGLLSRNFQGYCTRATTGQVYAFGVTGISQLTAAYSQNVREIPRYISLVNGGHLPVMRGYALNETEQLVREVITTLMCNERLNWTELAKHTGIGAGEIKRRLSYDESRLEEMAADGIIRYSPEEIRMNRGRNVFLRNVAAVFDPLMRNGKTKKFSRPV